MMMRFYLKSSDTIAYSLGENISHPQCGAEGKIFGETTVLLEAFNCNNDGIHPICAEYSEYESK